MARLGRREILRGFAVATTALAAQASGFVPEAGLLRANGATLSIDAAKGRRLRGRVMSSAELGRAVEPPAILVEVLATLASELRTLSAGDSRALLTRWRALAPLASGSAVECDGPRGRVVGVAAGIADDGALLVKVGDAVERIVAGEVLWR